MQTYSIVSILCMIATFAVAHPALAEQFATKFRPENQNRTRLKSTAGQLKARTMVRNCTALVKEYESRFSSGNKTLKISRNSYHSALGAYWSPFTGRNPSLLAHKVWQAANDYAIALEVAATGKTGSLLPTAKRKSRIFRALDKPPQKGPRLKKTSAKRDVLRRVLDAQQKSRRSYSTLMTHLPAVDLQFLATAKEVPENVRTDAKNVALSR